VSADPVRNPQSARRQGGDGGKYVVDAHRAMGVQVGDGSTQIIYSYNKLTWTDGVAPPPLVSFSGIIDSRTGGWARSRNGTRRSSSAAKRPPPMSWSGWHGAWISRAC
jgi:hypothetical protein